MFRIPVLNLWFCVLRQQIIVVKTSKVPMPTTVAPAAINVQIIPLRMQQRLGVSLAFVNISVKETLRTLVRTTPQQISVVSILLRK